MSGNTINDIAFAGVDVDWNGNVYQVTLVATVEANSADEAQAITGQLLAGLPTGQGHDGHALSGPNSWAPGTKIIERV